MSEQEKQHNTFVPKVVENKKPKGFVEKSVENYFETESKTNFDKNGNPKIIKVGRSKTNIHKQWYGMTEGWPKKVGSTLFYESEKGEVVEVKKPSQLFSMLSVYSTESKWAQGDDKSTKEEMYEYFKQSKETDSFSSIWRHPTWPTIEGVYYLKSTSPTEGTGILDQLVDLFQPATEVDRQLIKAAFCTPFWGGSPGTRPLFVIDSSTDDVDGGRGVGKTVLVETLAMLTSSNAVDLGAKTEQFEIMRRLLSTTNQKIVRWDNIKSNKFSNGDIESLITTKTISGHKMSTGLSELSNYFTYCATMNGASLSKDLAKRSVRIELGRPIYTSDWIERRDALISDHLSSIYGDIKEILTRKVDDSYKPRTRFGRWEKEVAVRVCGPLIGDHITREQTGVDAELDESEAFEDRIRSFIDSLQMTDGNSRSIGPNHTEKIYRDADSDKDNIVLSSSDLYTRYRIFSGNKNLSDMACFNGVKRASVNNLVKVDGWVKGVGRSYLWVANKNKPDFFKLKPGEKVVNLKDIYTPQA